MPQLELRSEAGVPRYFLEEKPVRPGDLVEVCWTQGYWHPLRFEWTGRPADPVRFYVGSRDVTGRVPNAAEVRWPQRRLS